MSLILEALRKSEAERLRAQGPGLHAPIPARPVRRVAPAWGPWVAVVLGAALLVGTWWVGRTEPAADAPAPSTREADVAPTPTPVAPAPAPVAVAPPVALGEAETPAPVPARPSPSAPDPEPDAAPEPSPPVAAAPLPAEPTPIAPAPEPSAPPDALPGLASLSTETRAALPPLKVSMHVWAADPARRFAIVDGQRVGEGALLAGGTVVEIRPDGVVLELQGRRVLLARP